VSNTYSYDALNRLIATTRLGITTSNRYDAANRLLSQMRQGTNGNLITLRSMGYDAARRVLRETNALGAVTSYRYAVDGSYQRVLTVTNANGGTRIQTFFRDGNLASVGGTATFPVRYEYGKTNDDYYRAYSKEIKLDSGGSDTSEWTQTLTDGLGRNYKTVFAGSGTPYRQSYYNFKGQLWKERDPDGVITLYTNNALGELEYTCIDSNRNDTIDFGGLDRITQSTREVASAHSTNVVRSLTSVWAVNGTDSSTPLSTVKRSVEGLTTWQSVAGAVSTTVRTLPSSGSYNVTQTAPDGSFSISLYQNGRLISVTRKDSNSVEVAKTTFGYDAHGRRSTSTDSRNGTTTFTYNNGDQVVTVTSPAPGGLGSAQTSATYYDAMGRATNIVQADGTSVTNAYSLRGELVRTVGSRTYPVGYAYDAQGRLKQMTNWSTYPSTGARVTTWNYHPERGWLTNKAYPDGLGPKH
jgi:YD repeat-containing protein